MWRWIADEPVIYEAIKGSLSSADSLSLGRGKLNRKLQGREGNYFSLLSPTTPSLIAINIILNNKAPTCPEYSTFNPPTGPCPFLSCPLTPSHCRNQDFYQTHGLALTYTWLIYISCLIMEQVHPTPSPGPGSHLGGYL